MSIVNRSILWELSKIFLLALLSITGMLLMAGLIDEASKQGLAPTQILGIIPLIVPSTLPYTIPATTLFATCIVYGRLAADNEILAIKAAGINVMHVVWPSMLVGLAMTLLTVTLYYELIPTTHHWLKSRLLNDLENLIYTMLKQNGNFRHPRMDFEMSVKSVQGHKLKEAIFKHRDSKTGEIDIVAIAREAELRVDMAHMKILLHMRHCYITAARDGSVSYVVDKIWPIDIPAEMMVPSKQRPQELTWPELHERVAELDVKLDELENQIKTTAATAAITQVPDKLNEHLQSMRGAAQTLRGTRRSYATEIHARPAMSLGCLCFVLIGCPVGIWFSRSDYLSAFVTCFLPIVVVYYPLSLCSLNLAKNGKLPIAASVWGVNLIIVLAAIPLYRRLLKN